MEGPVGAGHGFADVGSVEPEPSLLVRDLLLLGVEGMEERHEDEADEEHAVIEREDAQGAAGVKIAKEMRRSLGVEEDSGDEKTGEDEEEVDADAAGAGDPFSDGADLGAGLAHGGEVEEEYEEDGEAAQAIEGGDVAFE